MATREINAIIRTDNCKKKRENIEAEMVALIAYMRQREVDNDVIEYVRSMKGRISAHMRRCSPILPD